MKANKVRMPTGQRLTDQRMREAPLETVVNENGTLYLYQRATNQDISGVALFVGLVKSALLGVHVKYVYSKSSWSARWGRCLSQMTIEVSDCIIQNTLFVNCYATKARGWFIQDVKLHYSFLSVAKP